MAASVSEMGPPKRQGSGPLTDRPTAFSLCSAPLSFITTHFTQTSPLRMVKTGHNQSSRSSFLLSLSSSLLFFFNSTVP